jgi:hypothetical protein
VPDLLKIIILIILFYPAFGIVCGYLPRLLFERKKIKELGVKKNLFLIGYCMIMWFKL